MTNAVDLVTEIIRELIAIQDKPPRELVEEREFPVPSMLPVGNERGIFTSKAIEKNITSLGRLLKAEDGSLARRYTDAEWNSAVRNAIGPNLASIDLDDDIAANAAAVLTGVRSALAADPHAAEEREHALACTLFGRNDTAPFSIGPLRFEPRDTWLERKATDGDIPSDLAMHITARWLGEDAATLEDNMAKLRADAILDATGACPFVCSVKTSGYGVEAGKDKALTAARLGLTMIALIWQTPSRALEGFNLLHDRSVRHLSVLSFTPGKATLPGSRLSHMPHGPTLKPGEWEEELARRAPYFDVCGEILEFLLSPTGAVARPKLMNTLAQSFIWFHEACRETVGLMAVVNFAASLDTLACGRQSSGIRKLINARLGIPDTKPVYANGPTLKTAVDAIYSDGRSRAIHGTSQKIGHDWTSTRDLAEQFARLCLATCVLWASKHTTVDDPELLRT